MLRIPTEDLQKTYKSYTNDAPGSCRTGALWVAQRNGRTELRGRPDPKLYVKGSSVFWINGPRSATTIAGAPGLGVNPKGSNPDNSWIIRARWGPVCRRIPRLTKWYGTMADRVQIGTIDSINCAVPTVATPRPSAGNLQSWKRS